MTLPFAIWYCSPPHTREVEPLRILYACGMGALLAYPLGATLVYVRTTVKGGAWSIILPAAVWGLICLCIGAGVSGWLLLMASSDPDLGLWYGLRWGAVLMLVCAIYGAHYGAGLGLRAADAKEAKAHKTLDQMRTEMEAALEGRFGPLDEATRDKVRAWDEGRLAEAARRLPGAASLEEMGG